MLTQRALDIAVILALVLATAAAIIGFTAVLASGYTAGAYVHDLALLILGLAVLTVAERGRVRVMIEGDERDG